jgi:aldehyde dehydrogenase (NAD+)
VWSRNPQHAQDVARRVQTGSVGVNHYMPDPVALFGGVKASGIGRELGPEGLDASLQLQSIYEPSPQAADAPQISLRSLRPVGADHARFQ